MKLSADGLGKVVEGLIIRANRFLPVDVVEALQAARERETGGGRAVMEIILENARLAAATGLPICQDTGIDVIFLEIGEGVELQGDIQAAIAAAVARATELGGLRASVCHPLSRRNSGDNTPPVVHLLPGPPGEVKVSVLPKGCGSENMSRLVMLPPSKGVEGVMDVVVKAVEDAWANPCPPGIIGVGLGGTMEKAAFMAKHALLRPVGQGGGPEVQELEQELMARINGLGIGPLGLGGSTCTLAVAVELYPSHIASLPVAVNIQCHAARRASARLVDGRWIEEEDGVEWDHIPPPASTRGFRRISLPLSEEVMDSLSAGDWVLLSGRLFTARDQTHRLMAGLLEAGKSLPVDLSGELIYYVGPTPARDGRPIGSAGPTTSYRMDAWTPLMLRAGVRATMGKGARGAEVRRAMLDHGAVYFATLGGAGAYLSQRIKRCRPVAFEELGPEALFEMEVEEFPAVVVNDRRGRDLYEMVRSEART